MDAGLRDMPLHSLRHTAAAAWLASGHPLMFVQRQLGHASITTTEHHYGHFEATFLKDAAATTEAVIRHASRVG
jgi:integrase